MAGDSLLRGRPEGKKAHEDDEQKGEKTEDRPLENAGQRFFPRKGAQSPAP
jgi:hypothetical protein